MPYSSLPVIARSNGGKRRAMSTLSTGARCGAQAPVKAADEIYAFVERGGEKNNVGGHDMHILSAHLQKWSCLPKGKY